MCNIFFIFCFKNQPQTFNFIFQQSKNMDFNIFVSICAINTSLCNLFVYCLFGKIATESFENMADCLFETDWPDMSNELQKYLILLIANMQKSLFYHGFEVATLELETFTKVSTSNQNLIHSLIPNSLNFFSFSKLSTVTT